MDLPSPILDAGTEDETRTRAVLHQCLKSLKADPRHYTTTNAIEDLEDVRRALGIEQWNLLGVSYGTRKALTYLKYHPQAIRSVVLDGVVPQDEPLGITIDKNLTDALKKQFAECRQQPACQEAFGDVYATLWRLLEKYRDHPTRVRLPDPLSGEYADFELTRDNLALAVRLFAYAPATMALIPLLLDRATRDNASGIHSPLMRAVAAHSDGPGFQKAGALGQTRAATFWRTGPHYATGLCRQGRTNPQSFATHCRQGARPQCLSSRLPAPTGGAIL